MNQNCIECLKKIHIFKSIFLIDRPFIYTIYAVHYQIKSLDFNFVLNECNRNRNELL